MPPSHRMTGSGLAAGTAKRIQVTSEDTPEIREIKENLQKVGALYAGLSGSGSTVFGVFDNHQKAEALLENFSSYQTFLSSPVFRC